MTEYATDMLTPLTAIARAAGELIMAIYASDFAVEHKADASPVTQADQAAEALILARLAALWPDIPVVAEERVSTCGAPKPAALGQRFWLVDPLDGTREFLARNGEFTVNIGLIEHGRPVLGVVLAPALGKLWAGQIGQGGQGAWVEDQAGRRPIRCRAIPPEGLTVVASRSHGDAQALTAYLAGRRLAKTVNVGSSLKLCLVAEGQADLYPRLGRTMEWDIAAAHAVLAAAGGRVTALDGSELAYGKRGFDNPHFVASAG